MDREGQCSFGDFDMKVVVGEEDSSGLVVQVAASEPQR